jgi:hypothetical protein
MAINFVEGRMAKTRRPRKALEVTAEEQERADLERYELGRTTRKALALRARIVLSARWGSPTRRSQVSLKPTRELWVGSGNASEAAGRAG